MRTVLFLILIAVLATIRNLPPSTPRGAISGTTNDTNGTNTRQIRAIRGSILRIAGVLALFLTVPASATAGNSAGDACGSATPVLWSGLLHRALAGTDVYSDPNNPGLVVANIGSSGKDGVCVELEPSYGLRTLMAEVMPGDNIVGSYWTVLGLDGTEVIEAFSWQLDADPLSETHILRFADGFGSGDVVLSLYDDGQLVASETVNSGGEIATITEIGALLGLKATQVVFEPAVAGARAQTAQDMVVTTAFWHDLAFDLVSGSFVADEMRLTLAPGVVPLGYTATDDLWQFKAPDGEIGTVRLDATYLKIGDAWHSAELGRLRTLEPAGPLGTLSSFPQRNALITRNDLGGLPAGTQFSFLQPIRFTDADDVFVTEIVGSVEDGESQLLGSVAIQQPDATPDLCASFPDPAFSGEVLLTVLINDAPVFDTSFENGGCFNAPRTLRVQWTEWNDSDPGVTLRLGARIQGGWDAVIVVRPSGTPTSEIASFRHEHTRPQYVELVATRARH